MAIKLRQRVIIHSHQTGSFAWVPKSYFAVKLYPARLELYDYSNSLPTLISILTFSFSEKVHGFTVELDLEKGHLAFFGNDGTGYYKFLLLADKESLILQLKRRRGTLLKVKADEEFLSLQVSQAISYKSSSWSLACDFPFHKVSDGEFYFGSNKKMDWDRLQKKMDAKEIFPILFKAQHFWPEGLKEKVLESSAYHTLLSHLDLFDSAKLWNLLIEYLSKHLHGILLSSAEDNHYQGGKVLSIEESQSALLPVAAISLFAEALYYKCTDKEYRLLEKPHPKIIAGRALRLNDETLALSFSWSRRRLREVEFQLKERSDRVLVLPRGVSGFRLKDKASSFKQSIPGNRLDLSELSQGLYKLDRFHYPS